MSISIGSATQVDAPTAAQPAAARQPAPAQKPQATAAPARAATDTVQISAAAQALQEASETSVQTAREARAGDVQALRLQTREAAAQAITK